jgi:hypothetical protein
MFERRRRDIRCRVEELEGRAVPSIVVLKVAVDFPNDIKISKIHIIGYTTQPSVAGEALRFSVILHRPGQKPEIKGFMSHISSLPPSATLPIGVNAGSISGVFDASPPNFHANTAAHMTVTVESLHPGHNGKAVDHTKRADIPITVLVGSPPYLA